MNVADALNFAAKILRDAEVPDASRDAVLLLQHAIGKNRSFVIAHPEYQLSSREEDLFRLSISRRAAREPLQYILGRQEFYGLDFLVTPAVLIPRPETEMIVERALEILNGEARPRILEIGVGSGCIIISILKNSSAATAVAADISDEAIEVARRNAQMHQVDSRLEIVRSDILEMVRSERFDLIVSNPPYVPAADLDGLQIEVKDHEPHLALTDGAGGLSIVERIVHGAPRYLEDGGHLLIEIGFDQSERVRELFARDVWAGVEIEPDLQGIPRMVVAKLK